MFSRVTIATFAALALSLTSCTSTRGTASDDVDVYGESVQVFDVSNVKALVTLCYCPRRSSSQQPGSPVVELRATGRLWSVGYHGKQSDPEGALQELLKFTPHVAGDRLVLEGGHAWTHMHHSFDLSELRVQAPSGLSVIIEPLQLTAPPSTQRDRDKTKEPQ